MRTVFGAHDDGDFIRELRQNLIDSLSESELQVLCAKLKMNYDQLPGKSKAHKVDGLISYLRRNSRIHKIAELCRGLPGTVHPEAKTSAFGSHQSGPASILTRRERQIKHEEARLENRKNFLQQFFPGQLIALEKELCESWECGATQILHRFQPGFVKRIITLLSVDFDSIDYIDDLKQRASRGIPPVHSTASAAQSKSDLEEAVSLLSSAFMNYHSICCWYRNVRASAKSLLAVPALAAMMGLLLIAAYTAGVVLAFSGMGGVLFNNADARNPGLVFTVPESGSYYVEVKDAGPGSHSYVFGVTSPTSEVVVPDFSETDIWPLSPGDRVFAELHCDQQHVYRIDSDAGKTTVLNLYHWYADANLDFALLDSEMNECAAISLLERDLDSRFAYLTCKSALAEPHFLRVQMTEEQPADVLALSSRYGFQVFRMSDHAEIEPNDGFNSSTEVAQGTMVSGELSSSDRDFYYFAAQDGQQLEVGAVGLSDSSLSSVTLYRLTEDVTEAIAHSTRSAPTESKIGQNLFETSHGRAYAFSVLLRAFGMRVHPASLRGSIWEIGLLSLPLFLFLILMTTYVFFVTALSTRKYEESLVIRHMVNVLQKLDDDDALRSERKKASIRLSINRASDRIRKIHRISSFPALCAASTHMEDHMAKIASLVRRTNEVVSIPRENGLPSLRRSYIEWLDMFLNAEYGRLHFGEGFKVEHISWHQKAVYAVQQHWKNILGLAILAFIAALLTQPLWTDYWIEIATSTWLIIRYMILIIVVQALYSKWGSKDPGEKPATKWENAVRLILYFFVPLFGLDAVLQTGIVESIINLVSSLKIF